MSGRISPAECAFSLRDTPRREGILERMIVFH
ncbi:hypothetical protein BRAO375_4650015 [Bradyrhizobium sp. ORS 375]|nr:hypothetical protein BRAO375_4650015 [Bradyrhizobium sp. ORS 375]